MAERLSLALAQFNPTVGDVDGNAELIRRARKEAAAAGADVLAIPELALSGYPPEDLVLKPAFLQALHRTAHELARETEDGGPAVLLTTPWSVDGPDEKGSMVRRSTNSVLYLDGGRIVTRRDKVDLPNYGVFDEFRVFRPGHLPGPMNVRGFKLGLMICEDMWTPDAAETLAETGAEILIVPNGSPFERAKLDVRLQLALARVNETGLPLVYLHQVGGQDELVFDGNSFALQADGRLAAQLASFESQLALTVWERDGTVLRCVEGPMQPPLEGHEEVYRALMLGLSDYVDKNRFPGIVLGLSGGIDSAISAAIAVDALGAERVRAVMMPSPFTSQDSLDDAAECARLLGIRLDSVPIDPAMTAFATMLQPLFDGLPPGVAEENIQARARGLTLMAISNKLGPMVLSTGNKSEMSVGYATLYGDMCGGFNVLKDVYKTEVYALSRWRNQAKPAAAKGPGGRVIPERIITKAPTAELRPNQTDQDSLPPYEELDRILEGLVEREASIEELIEAGHARETVARVWRMLDSAEYKRRQACPGVKITTRALSRDRRYPITNGFRAPAG
ncbi:MAG TPA: NAD+ synthase [Kiloniellales bacterium]|nr:NAD+ synthase [Kiloniellales bacterium]